MREEEENDIRVHSRRALGVFTAWVLPVAPVAAYLNGMTMGVAGRDGVLAVAVVLPPIVVLLGLLYPYVALRALLTHALRTRASDAPGARLERILRLPWRAAVASSCVAWTLGGFFFSLPVCLWFQKDLFRVGVGTLIGLACGVVLGFPICITLERALLPLALAEQRRQPELVLTGQGLSWPRLAWFLPFTFVGSTLSTLMLSGCVVVMKLLHLRDTLMAQMVADGAHRSAARVLELGDALASELGWALAWVGGILLLLPTATTWLLARRQASAAGAVRTAIESLAAGRAQAPAWVSTDEIGDLAAGMNAVLAKLRRLPRALQASASQLSEAGGHLSTANDEQRESITRQAAALREAQVTSEEIKRTSVAAAQRAESVLLVAARAEELGRTGEEAVAQSLKGLTAIRGAVDGIQQRLSRLADSTTQIGEITEAVKDLADQSHLLAVNAAIEAARSGEAGRGFAVVAQEMRGLSNQSIQATRRIHSILLEISRGIGDAARMGMVGEAQVSEGLEQMRASGDSLRALSRISQESSTAARQIASAVTAQNAGFTQVFTAIGELSQIMGATLTRLESTREATRALQSVSHEVERMAEQFNVHEDEDPVPVAPEPPGAPAAG
ncbi:methyl-accepting chemotaxis protein [Myxococcaceae bacterium JPH2]|nr:methyl-accepting chemotaxis protein [Myxococcaceae bacterium JPH2]